KKGCPGDMVTFEGSGFKVGSTLKAEWADGGISEQFGPGASGEKFSDTLLAAKTSKEAKGVVPFFFQVWEGSSPPLTGIEDKPGEGTVKVESTIIKFTYKNLYSCFKGAVGATGPTGAT